MLTDEQVIKSEIRQCPFLGKKCIQEKCMLWIEYRTDEKKIFKTCALVIQPQLQAQGIVEQIRIIAGVDKLTNTFHATVIALQQGVMVPPLSGNSEKDKETIKKLQEGEV